jgi:type I restriction-modification system DNA methylase subunit
MNLREAYDLNKEIEEFILVKKTPYTADEVAYINQYTGFGGMWKFDENLKGDRGLYEYYTPWNVVAKMVGLAVKYGYQQGGPVLEPSCGIGRFLHYFSPATPVTGCEPDEISAAIAKANFPGYDIKKQTFNELFTDRSGKLKPIKAEYHLIIGNPPYGAFTGRLTAQEKQRTGATTYPEYFIRRSADLLLPGGLIVFIIPSAWIDSNQDVPGLELLEAYRMPISTFGGQTDVATDIVVYRKK